MSADILTTCGREVMAEQLVALTFLFALSRGDPSWDATWEDPNPPSPPLSAIGVLDLVGYARATVQGFLVPDEAGLILSDTGTKYTVSETRTRWARVRLSVPAGTYPDETIREIGLFSSPTIDAGVPLGQTIIEPADVSDPGDLNRLVWTRPQFLSAGTSIARNFVLRV
jgi:hypothetical protein